jgi:hypothetical protein
MTKPTNDKSTGSLTSQNTTVGGAKGSVEKAIRTKPTPPSQPPKKGK